MSQVLWIKELSLGLMNRYLFTLLLFFFSTFSYGQIGGEHNFQFLSLPVSSRLTGMGGSLVSIRDSDVSLAYLNPAILSSKTDEAITVSYDFHFAGIGNGYIGYGHDLSEWGVHSHVGINFISYGKFDRADELGNRSGSFSGSETAVIFGASKILNDKWSVGANSKFIVGALDSYNSFGCALDFGGQYIMDENTVLGFTVNNVGLTFIDYGEIGNRLPMNVQLGISKKLKYIPFRYNVTFHNLQTWRLKRDYVRNGVSIIGGGSDEESPLVDGIDNLFHHINISGELFLGKDANFKLRFGYNHMRRQELSVADFRSMAGFALGFGVLVKGLNIDYGIGYHHLAGATNHISISSTLGMVRDKISL